MTERVTKRFAMILCGAWAPETIGREEGIVGKPEGRSEWGSGDRIWEIFAYGVGRSAYGGERGSRKER